MRRRHVTSGESGHHGVGTGQHAAAAAAGAAQTATRAANLHVFMDEDLGKSGEEITKVVIYIMYKSYVERTVFVHSAVQDKRDA